MTHREQQSMSPPVDCIPDPLLVAAASFGGLSDGGKSNATDGRRRLYAGFQEAGLLMEFSREDGLAFD